MADLTGQTVVVIGGSSGIGLATALGARTAGADVIVTGRSRERLASVAADHDGIRTEALDSVDEAGTDALFAELGVVHHVFVAAGGTGSAPIDAPIDEQRPLLDTRLWGSVFAARAAAPRMPPAGSITFCSGTSSMRPWRGGSSVSVASCGAVEALARGLAVELAPIRVNVVVPGLVDTPLVAAAFGDQREARMAAAARSLPVGRVGRPEDLADAVLFLMGNGFVTGISLLVDGGRMLV